MNDSLARSVEHALLSAKEAEGWAAQAFDKAHFSGYRDALENALDSIKVAYRILTYVDHCIHEDAETIEIIDGAKQSDQ